ncbi:hypothetical protein DL96DRAFT_1681241 [Flagelloscypha sp. PMI_526]|nr:hypothetical protein DL96DRAFT_1681241 [Flagelloscypha sp. PMI_526]
MAYTPIVRLKAPIPRKFCVLSLIDSVGTPEPAGSTSGKDACETGKFFGSKYKSSTRVQRYKEYVAGENLVILLAEQRPPIPKHEDPVRSPKAHLPPLIGEWFIEVRWVTFGAVDADKNSGSPAIHSGRARHFFAKMLVVRCRCCALLQTLGLKGQLRCAYCAAATIRQEASENGLPSVSAQFLDMDKVWEVIPRISRPYALWPNRLYWEQEVREMQGNGPPEGPRFVLQCGRGVYVHPLRRQCS